MADFIKNFIKSEYLRNFPVFSSLSEEQLERIKKAPENGIEEFEPKDAIVLEGEVGDCMYVILKGAVDVTLQGESGERELTINTLHEGKYFGESALMRGKEGRRNASVRAIIPTRVFRIDKKYVIQNLDDTLEEEATDDGEIPDINSTRFEPDEVRDTIQKITLFKNLYYNELKTIHDWTEIVTYSPGDYILKESQVGDCMYVILEGKVEIFTLNQDGKVVILEVLKHGDYFGEQALMPDSDGTRNAFARSDADSRLVKIPKEYFRQMLKRNTELARELQKHHIEQKEKVKRARLS